MPTFASLSTSSPPSLVIDSDISVEIGSHEMFLEVYLDDYPGVSLFINFEIVITGCTITELTFGSANPDTYFYDIKQPGTLQQITIPNYTVVPQTCPGGE